MAKTLIDGNTAAAWAARLADVQVVPNFPITPQTEIIETLAQWSADGDWKGEFVQMEGEHSVLSAAVSASASGARVFTGTSSQGTLLMHEVMFIASGMRLPIVMVNVSRGLSAPITLWPDHNDFLDQRDTGWLMFCCETNQELLDTTIMSFRICEDRRVLLPALVNMDGFFMSFTREVTDIPAISRVRKFLPPYVAGVKMDTKKPMAVGMGSMEEYTYFREQVFMAHRNAFGVIEEVQAEWEKAFGRKYSLFEEFMMDGAEACLVIMGSNSMMAKAAVKRLREAGKKVGLVRLRLIRPFPEEQLKKALSKVKAIGVVDQNLSPGRGGILHPEIKAALYGSSVPVSDFIISLGGHPISEQHFEDMLAEVLETAKTGKEKRMWQNV